MSGTAATGASPAPPGLTSVDGEIVDSGEARIATADDGLLRGDGVFEVIKLYAGRPFALGEHLDRLERSAGGISLPVNRGRLESELLALLEHAGGGDGVLRVVLTRGGRRLAMLEALPLWGETIALATVTYSPSVILTGVKSISYAANMEATRIAARRGAEEALLVRPDGIVLEAPTSAVFWAEGDTLRTPSLDCGILDSITRGRVIATLEVEQGKYELDRLRGADEAFLASTTREIQPLSALDGAELPSAPGPVTAAAIEAFAATVRSELG